jgi:dienelactone hydrolase
MKTFQTLLALAALVLLACETTAARAGQAANANGTIVERSSYVFPTYDQLPAWAKRIYTSESYEAVRNSPDLELLRIKYVSDGLKVVGFIYKPKNTSGKHLPLIIWNRGGVGEDAKIGNENFQDIYEMHRYAAEGFVVLASQYRGTDGGEGRDEVGGADLNDVLNLVPLAKSLGYVDLDRVFMWGFSRGALMALQAVKQGLRLRAVAVVGPPTDWEAALRQNPNLIQFARQTWPDFDARRQEITSSRSPVLWVDKVDVPLLIFNGGADAATPPAQTIVYAQKLEEAGKLYELTIYAKDDHEVSQNREERIRRTIDWFKNPRAMSIVQAIRKTLNEQGVEAAIKQYDELKKEKPERYDWGEAELNRLGYELLRTNRIKEAIEIFKLNVAAYPAGFNTYDSLGEAYLAGGERELAIKNYKKSLELNPQNTNAAEVLKRLSQK